MEEIVDVHNSKKRYSDFVEKINKLSDSEGKETLLKYISWHDRQLENNKMSYSSCTRSLQIAYRVIDSFPKPSEITQKKLEEWFEVETKRNKLHRTGGGYSKETKDKISLGTIQKTQSQLMKFIKFIEFLKLNKPINLFNSKRIPVPLVAQFCFSDTTKNKFYEPPRVSQEQIKELIDYLLTTGNYIDEVTGVLVAYTNDTGCRNGEALSLRHENLFQEEGYWLAQLPESKTKTRTNVLLLSKEYMSKWLAKCPTKDNKKGLIFCNKKGNKLSYDSVRLSLKKALEKKNIDWKAYSAFHYIRNLASSRVYDMPQNLAEYYFGWKGSGMRAVYSTYNWKACLPYLLKSIKGNPMADAKLSYMEETKSQEELMKEAIREAVRLEIAKSKG